MQHGRILRRSALLLLALAAGTAASDVGPDDAWGTSRFQVTEAYGRFLAGRHAAVRADMATAATDLLAALDKAPEVGDLQEQAFVASVLSDRPEAYALARDLPDNVAAQLLLGGQDARAGRWDDAGRRFATLPKQGPTSVLGPLLGAWAQAGAGRTDAALATLQPYVDGQRFRGVYSLHAALIADLGGRTADAARLYGLAQAEYGELNLRLGAMLASWQARQGRAAAAREVMRALVSSNPDLAIARPALEAAVATPPVPDAVAGLAEVYLALAATLRQQDASDLALLLLHLALDLRPDFTAARILTADIQTQLGRGPAALDTLAPVPDADPMIAVVQLRRASLLNDAGKVADAAAVLEALAERHPDRPEPLAELGDELRRKSRFADAVTAYNRAVARVAEPGRADWSLFYQRGVALDRSGQWSRAEADLTFALQLMPDQPYVLNYLGYSWTEQNRNLDRAQRLIERAVEQRPNDGSIVDSLGWVQLRRGDVAGAVRSLEKAVELQPEDGAINGHLGDALLAAGRALEAEYQWRHALILNPEAEEAARIEARLRALPPPPPPSQAGPAGPAPGTPSGTPPDTPPGDAPGTTRQP